MPKSKQGATIDARGLRLVREGGGSSADVEISSLSELEAAAVSEAAPDALLHRMCEVPARCVDALLTGASDAGVRAVVRPRYDGSLEEARRGDWISAEPMYDDSGELIVGISVKQEQPWVPTQPLAADRSSALCDLQLTTLQLQFASGTHKLALSCSTRRSGGTFEYRWPSEVELSSDDPVQAAAFSLSDCCWTFPGLSAFASRNGFGGTAVSTSSNYAVVCEFHRQLTASACNHKPFEAPAMWIAEAKEGLADFAVPHHTGGRMVPEMYCLKAYCAAFLLDAFAAYYQLQAGATLPDDRAARAALATAVKSGEEISLVYQLVAVESVDAAPDGFTTLVHFSSSSSYFAEESAFADNASRLRVLTREVFTPEVASMAPLLHDLGASDLTVKRSNYVASLCGVDARGGWFPLLGVAEESIYAGVTASFDTAARRELDAQSQLIAVLRPIDRQARAAVADEMGSGPQLLALASRVLGAGVPPAALVYPEWLSQQPDSFEPDCTRLLLMLGIRSATYVVHSAMSYCQMRAACVHPTLVVGAWGEARMWDMLCRRNWVDTQALGRGRSLLWAEAVLICFFRRCLRGNRQVRPVNHLVGADALPGSGTTRAAQLLLSDALAACQNPQVTLALRILESEWTTAEIVRSIDAPFSGQQSRCPPTHRELQRICCLIEDAAGLGFHTTRAVAGALRDLDLFTEVTASLRLGGGSTMVTVRDDAPRLGRTTGASAARARFLLYGFSLLPDAEVDAVRGAFLDSFRRHPAWPSRGSPHDRLSDDFLRARAESRPVTLPGEAEGA